MLKNRDIPKELICFNSLFFKFQNRFELSLVFNDFLTIVICCLGHGTQEPLYFETIKKYSKEELNTFCKLFAEILIIYENANKDKRWCDPLGDYYECLASNYKKSALGQFFTPKHLCDMIAQITAEPENFGKKINEPCSGSGRMVLAFNHVSKGNYFVCEDIDEICCKMTAINMCMHEIRGEVHCHDVIRGDSDRFAMAINYDFWKHKTKLYITIIDLKRLKSSRFFMPKKIPQLHCGITSEFFFL